MTLSTVGPLMPFFVVPVVPAMTSIVPLVMSPLVSPAVPSFGPAAAPPVVAAARPVPGSFRVPFPRSARGATPPGSILVPMALSGPGRMAPPAHRQRMSDRGGWSGCRGALREGAHQRSTRGRRAAIERHNELSGARPCRRSVSRQPGNEDPSLRGQPRQRLVQGRRRDSELTKHVQSDYGTHH